MTFQTGARKPVGQILQARHYALLTLGFLVFVLYGSFVPFQYRSLPWEEALTKWAAIPWYPVGTHSRADFVANLLLFIPLAFGASAIFCVDQPRELVAFAALVVIPSCVALCVGMEFTQLFFPPRTVSQNDIWAEGSGAVLGVLAWASVGQQLTDWTRNVWARWGRQGQVAQLLPGYLVLLAVIHVMPVDLTISPYEVYHKFRTGQVLWMPFSAPSEGFWLTLIENLWVVAFYLPVGLLVARLPRRMWKDGLHVLGYGLALAGIMEFLQLFVISRVADITDVLLGGGSVWLGWGLVQVWERREHTEGVLDQVSPSTFALGLVFLWGSMALIMYWHPFDFVLDPEMARARGESVSLIPFLDYYLGTEYNAFEQCLRKGVMFGLLGAILAFGLDSHGEGGSSVLAIMIAGLMAIGLEVGQLFLPGRFASLTDVLVEVTGAGAGYHAVYRLKAANGKGLAGPVQPGQQQT